MGEHTNTESKNAQASSSEFETIVLKEGEQALYIGSGPEKSKYEHLLLSVKARTYKLSDLDFENEEETHEINGKKIITTNKNGLDCLDDSIKYVLLDQAVPIKNPLFFYNKLKAGTYLQQWLAFGNPDLEASIHEALGFKVIDRNRFIYQKIRPTTEADLSKAKWIQDSDFDTEVYKTFNLPDGTKVSLNKYGQIISKEMNKG